MNLKFVNDYMNKKINENDEIIIYSFYELRLKNNLSVEDTQEFLGLNKIRFENLGYKVYFTGDKYQYKGEEKIVTDNQLLVAIKEK